MARRGQASAEMAIFGSIMLLGLAGTLRFGLRYVYQMQADQEAFRHALYRANEDHGYDEWYNDGNNPWGAQLTQNDFRFRSNPSSGASYSVVRDRYLPDPSRPLAIGDRVPFSGSASVMWGNRHQLSTANAPAEFQEAIFNIKGEELAFTPGKFIAFIVPNQKFEFYARIFCDPDADDDDEFELCGNRLHKANSRDGVFNSASGRWDLVEWKNRNWPVVGPPVVLASQWFNKKTILVMDPCAGYLLDDPTACIRQCTNLHRRKLPMPPYCTEKHIECSTPPYDESAGCDAQDRTPQRGWTNKKWNWPRLSRRDRDGDGDIDARDALPLHGPDFNNQTRLRKSAVKVQTRFGSPQTQTLRRYEAETITGRVFAVQDAGAPDAMGSYDQIKVDFRQLHQLKSPPDAPAFPDIEFKWEKDEQRRRTLP